MRILAIAIALTLCLPGLAQKPSPQTLLAGRCHKSGDATMRFTLHCTDESGSLFCGLVSSTLRSLPKTEMAYSDAESDFFIRVFRVGDGAGFYLGQPLVFPNGHSTGGAHYLKEGTIRSGTDETNLGSDLVHKLIAPSMEVLRADIEEEVIQKKVAYCAAFTDEVNHEQ
jgi:hypothetical protein